MDYEGATHRDWLGQPRRLPALLCPAALLGQQIRSGGATDHRSAGGVIQHRAFRRDACQCLAVQAVGDPLAHRLGADPSVEAERELVPVECRPFQPLAATLTHTRERGGERLEWAALDWNELALGFYERLGAVKMGEWVTHRMPGAARARLAGESAGLALERRR